MQHNEPPVIRIRSVILDDSRGRKFPKQPLGDGENSMRYERVEELLRAGKTEKLAKVGIPAVKGLVKASENPELRIAALETLGKIAWNHPQSDWKDYVELFPKASRDGDANVRESAIRSVIRIATDHPEYDWSSAIPLLIRAFDIDIFPKSPAALFRAITEKHPEYDLRAAVEPLSKAVGFQWNDATEALGNIGDVSAAPALEAALRSDNKDMVGPSLHALRRIMEKNPDHDWRRTAKAILFGRYGWEGLSDEANQMLMWLGPKVIPALVEALEEKGAMVRERAVDALHRMAQINPNEVALQIVGLINGKLGDRLLEISKGNEELMHHLNELMLRCGDVMENSAESGAPDQL